MISKLAAILHLPRFAPDIERQFQEDYYIRVRATLRLISGLLAAAIEIYALLSVHQNLPFVGTFSWPELVLCLLVFGLTWHSVFRRLWQPLIVVAGWITAFAMLGGVYQHLLDNPLLASEGVGLDKVNQLVFALQVCVLLIILATFRLPLMPSLALQVGVALIGIYTFSPLAPLSSRSHSLLLFAEPVLLVLLAVLLVSFVQEKLARGAFEYSRRLADMQREEQTRRVATENMLHVLNGAIGSVIHDLGNPLTTVQTGAELTRDILVDGKGDKASLQELNAMVLRGAKMLSYLRLSLIEQARVLEGRPVPVELKPVPVRAIVEAGANFQQARYTQSHMLHTEGEDTLICADEMKMVTVLMNLIGNSFKYSDAEVCVAWRKHEDELQIAVMDKGHAGHGLSHTQAQSLFRAFGRLETHTDIEGTGLGLLSVQKVVEAHGGEVWIEGYEDGTPDTPCFSTGRFPCPSFVRDAYLTAFIITCPLAP